MFFRVCVGKSIPVFQPDAKSLDRKDGNLTKTAYEDIVVMQNLPSASVTVLGRVTIDTRSRPLPKAKKVVNLLKEVWMKTTLLALVLLAAGSSFAQISIGVRIGPPPPPRVIRVQPRAPGPGYIWVDGHWQS